MEATDTAPDDSKTLARRGTFEPADTQPPESELVSRADAMRMLGIGNAKISEMVKGKELRAWGVGSRTMFERAELEALASRDGQATVLGEAVRLLKQSHSHNEAAMRMLGEQAQAYATLSAKVVEHLLARNEKLEATVNDQRDLVAKAHADETGQALALMEAENTQERNKALLRSGERALPILIAKLTGKTTEGDAALAGAVRAIAADAEFVTKIRSALTPTEGAQLDALLTAAKEGAPT